MCMSWDVVPESDRVARQYAVPTSLREKVTTILVSAAVGFWILRRVPHLPQASPDPLTKSIRRAPFCITVSLFAPHWLPTLSFRLAS